MIAQKKFENFNRRQLTFKVLLTACEHFEFQRRSDDIFRNIDMDVWEGRRMPNHDQTIATS